MDGKRKEETTKEKKPYRKPELKKVTLAPNEAVLGNCKGADTTNSNVPLQNCTLCGQATGS